MLGTLRGAEYRPGCDARIGACAPIFDFTGACAQTSASFALLARKSEARSRGPGSVVEMLDGQIVEMSNGQQLAMVDGNLVETRAAYVDIPEVRFQKLVGTAGAPSLTRLSLPLPSLSLSLSPSPSLSVSASGPSIPHGGDRGTWSGIAS